MAPSPRLRGELRNASVAPGALEQRLGDEQAEAQAAAGLGALARRHIGLADAVDDFGQESPARRR